MDPVRFTIKDSLSVHGRGVVLIGRLESGVIRKGEHLFLKNDLGCFPVAVTDIEQWRRGSFTEAVPGPGDYGLTVTGITKDLVQPQDLLTNVGYYDATGDRSGDYKSQEELLAGLESSGASARYTQLLQRTGIAELRPFFEVATRVQARPELLAPLILDDNWRLNIVGTALAVLIGSERLAPSMIDQLVRGSWAAPQLAAAIASVVTSKTDVSKLRDLLKRADAASEPKTLFSAFAALDLLGDSAAREFVRNPAFSELRQRDEAHFYLLAARWRGIWMVAGPYFRTTLPKELAEPMP